MKSYTYLKHKKYIITLLEVQKNLCTLVNFFGLSFPFYFTLCEFTVMIFFFSEKVARDAETSIKFQRVLKSTAWPRRDSGFRARSSGKLTGGKFN